MADVDDDIGEEEEEEQVHGDDPEFVDDKYHTWIQYYDASSKNVVLTYEEKECNSKNRGGPYYEYQQNDISIIEPAVDHDFEFRDLVWTTSKHDVYHMSNNAVFYYSAVTGNKSEVLNFSGTVAPVEKHPGNWFQGLTATQVTTLASKDKLLVAGGSQGELMCKYIDRPGASFGSRVMPDVNAIMSCIEIYNSPSGAVHFTASNKGCVVRDFDVETFQLSKHLDFSWPVNHTSLSPDGKLLVVAGDSNDGLLVNLESGEMVGTLQRHMDYSVASAWHPDGQTFVTGNKVKSCLVWDVRYPSCSFTILDSDIGAAQSIRFTSDRKFMAVAEPEDYVHIYDVNNGRYEMKPEEIRFFGEITGISFSPDTESLLIGTYDDTRSSLLQFRRRRNIVKDFQLSNHFPVIHTSLCPDGKLLVVVGDSKDGLLVNSQRRQLQNLVWATSNHNVYLMSEYSLLHYSALTCTKSEIFNFRRAIAQVEKNPGFVLKGLATTLVSTLAIKDKLLVTGGCQGELICKYLDRPEVSFCSRVTPDVNAIMSCIEIYNSPSGAVHFMASNKDCGVRDFDVETFQLSKHLDFSMPVNHTSLSPYGKPLVVVGDTKDEKLVDSQSGEAVGTLHGHKDYSVASAWHPDGVSFCSKVTPNVNSIMSCIEVYNSPSAVHFTASNKDCVLRDFDVETFQLSKHLDFPMPLNHTSLSPDGKLLVIVGDSKDGLLVNSESGETIGTLQGHMDYSVASLWHPYKDKSCLVWDVNIGAAQSIRFTSDGKFMEPEDYVHIYHVKNGQMEELLEQSIFYQPPFPIWPYQPPPQIFQPYHYPVYSTLVGPSCPPIYYYPPPQIYPLISHVPRPITVAPCLPNGTLSPYYILCLQWGRTTRIHHVEPFMDALMEITIHGLWEKNFGGGIYGGKARGGRFDPTLGGDNLLVARANQNWLNVLVNPNPHDILTHNQRLWRGEWISHGLRCPLTQDEYFRTTLDRFDEIALTLGDILDARCFPLPIDQFGRRLLGVTDFLAELEANSPELNGIPILPSLHVRPNPWFGEDLHEFRYYLDASLNFIPAMRESNCTLEYIEVP